MYIETKNLIIREIEEKDAGILYQFAREPNNQYYAFPDYENPQDYLDDTEWFKEPSDSIDICIGRYHAVVLPDSDEMIGVVARGPKERNNEIEIGYFMSEKYRRKGFAEEAVNAFIEWCFKVSDIACIYATVSCDNLPSNRLIEKCKFELYEKRTPIKQGQLMENKSYFYYKKHRV